MTNLMFGTNLEERTAAPNSEQGGFTSSSFSSFLVRGFPALFFSACVGGNLRTVKQTGFWLKSFIQVEKFSWRSQTHPEVSSFRAFRRGMLDFVL